MRGDRRPDLATSDDDVRAFIARAFRADQAVREGRGRAVKEVELVVAVHSLASLND
jgi:hypothetical protein